MSQRSGCIKTPEKLPTCGEGTYFHFCHPASLVILPKILPASRDRNNGWVRDYALLYKVYDKFIIKLRVRVCRGVYVQHT